MSDTPPNPVRACIGCGQSDDHPKHQIAMPGDVSVFWHFDCHSLAVPPCTEPCAQIVADSGGLTGEELRDFLTQGG